MLGLILLTVGVSTYVGISVLISLFNEDNLNASLTEREIEALTFFENVSEND